MSSLKEFIDNHKNKPATSLPAPSSNELRVAISSQISAGSAVNLSTSEKDKFSVKVADLARSDAVMSELSDALRSPKETESEEEFVNRAKLTLRKILKSKLQN